MPDQNATAAVPQEKKPRKGRYILAAVGALIAVIVLAMVFLPYLVPSAWLASVAESSIAAAFERDASLGKVSWGWFAGVTVTDVSVADRAEFGGGRFLEIDSLSLHVNLRQLVRSRGADVRVESLVIDSPRVNIVKTAEGRYNFESLVASPTAPAPPRPAAAYATAGPAAPQVDMSIRRLEVRNGSVRFDDREAGATFEAAGVAALIRADLSAPRIEGAAELSFQVVQRTGNATVRAAAENVSLDRLAAGGFIEGAAAEGTLTIDGVDLAQALSAAPGVPAGAATGVLSVKLGWQIDRGLVRLTGTDGLIADFVAGQALIADGPIVIGDVDFDLAASARASDPAGTLSLESLNVTTPFARIAAAVTSFDPGALIMTLDATLEPARVPAALFTMPDGVSATGTTDLSASLDLTRRPYAFTGSLDTRALGLTTETIAKNAGVPASAVVEGTLSMEPLVVVIDSLAVVLAGGELSAEGELDMGGEAVVWNAEANLARLNLSDYIKIAEPVHLSGGVRNSGRFHLAEQLRDSDFVLDGHFRGLTAHLPERPGVEIALDGEASVNSVRATASNFMIGVGSDPITVNAEIREPLARPAGLITMRGRTIDFEYIAAVAAALGEAATDTAVMPGPPDDPEDEPDDEGFFSTLADIYVNNADVNLDLRIDQATFAAQTGTDLVIDAALTGGTLTVREAAVNIFGGRVTLDSIARFGDPGKPARLSLDVSRLQAREPVEQFLSQLAYGVGFSGVMDLSMQAAGALEGSTDDIARSFAGSGTFTVTDGVLSLPGVATALARLQPGLDLTRETFRNLTGSLNLENGILEATGEIVRGDMRFVIDGRVSYTGESSQVVSMVPPGLAGRIRLVTVENGVPRYEALGEDLLRAGLIGIITRELAPDEPAEPTERDRTLRLLRDILSTVDGSGRNGNDDR